MESIECWEKLSMRMVRGKYFICCNSNLSNVSGGVQNCNTLKHIKIINSAWWQIEKTHDRTSKTMRFCGRHVSVFKVFALTSMQCSDLPLLYDIKEAFCKKHIFNSCCFWIKLHFCFSILIIKTFHPFEMVAGERLNFLESSYFVLVSCFFFSVPTAFRQIKGGHR